MTSKRVGIVINRHLAQDSAGAIEAIRHAEKLGIHAVWMTTGPGHAGPSIGTDALTVFAAAAVQTDRVLMGTAIVPILLRHPIVVAQQVQVVSQLSGGRVRVGVGTGHRRTMSEAIGDEFQAPLEHLRDYLRILKALLHQGRVDMDGKFFKAHVHMASPVAVPVMASALGPKSFELCGAEADGAISWLCPWLYLRDVALPGMRAGAKQASRPVPPLVAHAPVLVHENVDEVRKAVREHVATNPRSEEFARMFRAAGFSEVADGRWSDAMIEGVAIYGDEGRVAEGLGRLFSIGADEIIVAPIPVGDNQRRSIDRTLNLLAEVCRSSTGL